MLSMSLLEGKNASADVLASLERCGDTSTARDGQLNPPACGTIDTDSNAALAAVCVNTLSLEWLAPRVPFAVELITPYSCKAY